MVAPRLVHAGLESALRPHAELDPLTHREILPGLKRDLGHGHAVVVDGGRQAIGQLGPASRAAVQHALSLEHHLVFALADDLRLPGRARRGQPVIVDHNVHRADKLDDRSPLAARAQGTDDTGCLLQAVGERRPLDDHLLVAFSGAEVFRRQGLAQHGVNRLAPRTRHRRQGPARPARQEIPSVGTDRGERSYVA